ncbi:MAG: tRNA (N(6)-L-threonylcarbamoyladenosine(37)-C(2))-methylthiotransferase MtaB [Nitrospirota bacterium]
MKFHIKSLGCKINQFDAATLGETLSAGGGEAVALAEDADVQVIFTCTVTGKSDYQCRQEIRRAVKAKGNGSGMVLVTGCYAQTAPEAIKKIDGVDTVIGNENQGSIPDIIGGRFGFSMEKAIIFGAQAIGGRSRAFLKAQEGCDSFCSYCIVPYARGRSRSARLDDVLAKANGLIANGYHEIVLTGVHLGAYGKDIGGLRLSDLVAALLDRPGLGRLRLSSIEPMEIDGPLLELVGFTKFCRHLHVPLQNANDNVLASMGRGYTWNDYLKTLKGIEKAAPGACIGADVIVGYPNEDADAFEETLRRVEDSPINYLHVFSYSPRSRTRAYEMGDTVKGDVKRERSERLRELGNKKNLEFRRSLVGKVTEVVVEAKNEAYSGLTDNYVRVTFDGKDIPSGKPVKVKITGTDENSTRGRIDG